MISEMTKLRSHAPVVLLAVFFAVIAGFFGCAGPIKSERLSTLLELKEEQEILSEALEQDTENFETVHDALQTGAITKGLTKDLVKNKVGEPLIVYSEGGGEKWVYKEAGENRFGGSKIYLFFNSAGEFSKYQCVRIECPSS